MNKNLPKLRFARFTDDWTNEKFSNSEIASFSKGRGVSKNDLVSNGGNQCILYGELYTHYNEIIFDIVSRTKISPNQSLASEIDDLIIPSSGETAIDISKVCCVRKKGVLLGGDLSVIRLKKGYGPFFAYYLSNFKKIDIAKFAQGHSVVHLYASHLKLLNLNLPKIEEQQKIAEFLEAVDGWIENHEKQKMALEEYKNGMMQKIFSQKIRFKEDDGSNFPDWEEKRLGELFAERVGRKGNRDFQLLSVSINGGVGLYDEAKRNHKSSENKSNYKIVYKDNIAYNTMRMWQGASGVSNYNGIVSPAYTVVSLKQGSVKFYGYLFKFPRTIFDFYRYSQGLTSDTWNLKFKHFSEVKVTIPESEIEQRKIAEFLESIDQFIQLKQKQIDKAKLWKKGLLQQMFV